ncbi:hypothetical protein WMF27_09340 [Sorangium sp. So ce281]|uniref:hypothetical protein n=1 Tax=unclassified Sorangium TaxID=2621164 RepID=UPI003F5FCED9
MVLAESPRAVLSVLGQVPEPKRPALNDRMLQAFEAYYPGWPVAVCCWNGDLQPEPLLWWYEPTMRRVRTGRSCPRACTARGCNPG